MAEISNRAVATAAGGALLAVALAFVGKADAQQYDRAVHRYGNTVSSVGLVTRTRARVVPPAGDSHTNRCA